MTVSTSDPTSLIVPSSGGGGGGGGGGGSGSSSSDRRFYRSPMWKHIVTRRNSVQVADFSRLASSRRIRFELGGPSSVQGFVPSDDARVWLPADDNFQRSEFDPFYYSAGATVDLPRLSEGSRLMYSFRRENIDPNAPWVIRHAGPILEVEDDADPSKRLSRFGAYDPWQYLYQRPVRRADPDKISPSLTVNPMPGEQGTVFPAGTSGDAIVTELLRRTIEEDGDCYIDAGLSFGGTAIYLGTIETTATFIDPVIFPRGTSVGTAWEQLVDTGTLDIVLKPIWDPIDRPGYCVELNVYATAAQATQPSEVFLSGDYPTFRWDRTGRSILQITRLQDGRERANRIRGFSGGTGSASNPWTGYESGPDLEATYSDADSSDRFGESWLQQTYVRQVGNDHVIRQTQDDLFRRRVGARTWRMAPTPEFSPRPFLDYDLGWYAAFYHSRKLREEQWWIPEGFNDQSITPRIYGFTIDLSDDSLETVTELDIGIDDPIATNIS